MTCIFCDLIRPEQILLETPSFKLVFDIDPIQTGHLLVISKAHVMSIAELDQLALHELIELEAKLVGLLEAHLPISGVTLASNDRDLLDSGTHFHRHLIPRQAGDGFWDSLDLTKEKWDLSQLIEALSNH